MSEKSKLCYTPFFGCMISTKYPQFEASVRKTLPNLDVELKDLDGFSCCPDPIYFKAFNKEEWLTLAARNLCIAEEAGMDLVTCCSGCTATLKEANHLLQEDEEIKERVNKRLKKVGKQYKGTSEVKHIVTVVRDNVGMDRVAASVTRPLEGLRVAIHYGCHLLKPSPIMKVDDPDRPTILEDLMNAIGAEPVEHEEKVLCCGKACMDPDIPGEMTRDVLKSIMNLDVACMGLICPTCVDEYDVGQIMLSRKFKEKFNLPVIYYFQLLGLAQGIAQWNSACRWRAKENRSKRSSWPPAPPGWREKRCPWSCTRWQARPSSTMWSKMRCAFASARTSTSWSGTSARRSHSTSTRPLGQRSATWNRTSRGAPGTPSCRRNRCCRTLAGTSWSCTAIPRSLPPPRSLA